jgi:hypothetical protein
MASVAARTPPRRRGGLRILVALAIVILLVGGALVWLNVAAQASVNASALLTVYQPAASVSHGGGAFSNANTGAVIDPGDTVKTDDKGRASITLPDGTVTRMAKDTSFTVDAAHFNKTGTVHDVTLAQQIGRTFTNVQHLVSGATFNVKGKSATASVRGTKFEVYIKADGTMIVKLFQGTITVFSDKGSVTFSAPQQVVVSPDGTIGQPGPIIPDPDDPFGPEINAQDAVSADTTPGTEQDFIGPVLHDGESTTTTYSYAGGHTIKAALAYAGSAMKLTAKAPDGQQYVATGKLPTIVINNAPSGIYTFIIDGIRGLGPSGEQPFLAVASVEDCKSADVAQNGAVHRGYTAADLVSAVELSGGVPGVSNLSLNIAENQVFGAIIDGKGSYNGLGWTGSVVVVPNNFRLDIMPISGTVLGVNVPAATVVQQVANAIGQDPSNVYIGFNVERLFTCSSVLMIDGRVS